MYKAQKILFDKVFYGPANKLMRLALFLMLLSAFLFMLESEVGTLHLVARCGVFIFLFIYLFIFVKGYAVTAGINNKGVYNWLAGWINWNEIEGIELGETRIKKTKCIFIKLKKDAKLPFFKKLGFYCNFLSATNIPVISKYDINIPLEEFFDIIKDYHQRYGRR